MNPIAKESRGLRVFSPCELQDISRPDGFAIPSALTTVPVMNSFPLLHPSKLPGFKVVPKRQLQRVFSPSQSAYYVLLGRRGASVAPRERVLFVHYLDHFVDGCQRQIDELWQKHRVLITHVAVKLTKGLRDTRHDFSGVYERAVNVQHLRNKLQPRFRRL